MSRILKNWFFLLLLAFTGVILASPVSQGILAGPVPFDTEISTNLPIVVEQQYARTFSFTLTGNMTVSNNVELAFGCDGNTNGVLDLAEIRLQVGWDRGQWMIREGSDGVRQTSSSVTTNTTKILAWRYRPSSGTVPPCLAITENGLPIFTTIVPASQDFLSDRRWNLLRVTARGIDPACATYSITTAPDALNIFIR